MNPIDLLRIEFRTLETLAVQLNIKPNTIYQWRKSGVIPFKYVREIIELSDGRLTKEELRPDLVVKG